jgi:hypothetical protein
MNEYKLQLLDYISRNYENVVKPAQGGEYIEIDLIPNSHDGLHDLPEILEYCEKKNMDVRMFMRSYPTENGDGIRMGRYWYYMQKTTKAILNDLKYDR